MKIIAKIYNDFTDKFGIPRQGGLSSVVSEIRFEPHYRNIDALRGIEDFSHLWLIWNFSRSEQEDWSPTVRPPRLGGNKKVGIFATRSPYRPNPIGLSVVELIKVEQTEKYGPVLYVKGADLLNKTPIYDIKPYIPFCDCHTEATEGYTETTKNHFLSVECSENLINIIEEKKRETLLEVLSGDPRPSYQNDDNRIYGMDFAGFNIKFSVNDNTLTVKEIKKLP